MCDHPSILMLAAKELATAIEQGAKYDGRYTCMTCRSRCVLHVTFPDGRPKITVSALGYPEPPTVYRVGADAIIRKGT
jgi:hypothetical protein